MNLKMGSRIIAATGIAALLFALAACNQPNNASKGTQGQSTQTSKDELDLKDKVSKSLTSAVTTLNAKKITLDPTNKKFTIEAASTATELSAKDIFTGTDYNGMTQEFTVTPASGSVTVAGDKSKLTIGYAGNTAGDTYTVTLTFTKDKKVSTFNFTVINKKPQPPKPSKDELSIQSDVEKSLAAAVAALGTKKITLDATAKKFTIEAESTVTELSATDIFKDAKFVGMTKAFTLNPANGSVTVASDASKLAVGYAKSAEGDTFMVTLAFTKEGKSSKFDFTVINKKKQPPKDDLKLKDKVAKALANAVENLKKKDINLTAAENKFVIGPDSAITELSAKEIFKDGDFTGMEQEFKILTAVPSVTLASDKSKLTIKVASKPEGERAEVQLTFKKGAQVSEFKFTIINKKQNALRDDLNLKDEVKKSLASTAAVEKLKKEGFLFDAVEKKFVVPAGSEAVEFFFKDYFPKNQDKYKDTERELTVTPAGGSITKGFSDTELGSLDVKYAKDSKNGDTFTVMYKFTKEDGKKVSEFKFTFVNMKKKVYHKNQIKGQIERCVHELNGDPTLWMSTKKYMYQYKEKNKAIRLPKKGDKDDIKDVALTWGLKKGYENGARIDKNKDGESIVIIDDAKVGHKVVLTVTAALPGENMVFEETPEPTNTNANLAFVLTIES